MQQAAPLESILQTTQDKMHDLLQLLKAEAVILEKSDIEQLESITIQKIAVTEEIEKHEQQRIHFLNQKSLDPNEPTQWLKNNKLISIWSKIKTLSEKAQKQNQVNGMVINGNRRRIQSKIEIFSSSVPASELTYSSSGENINQNSSKTLAHA